MKYPGHRAVCLRSRSARASVIFFNQVSTACTRSGRTSGLEQAFVLGAARAWTGRGHRPLSSARWRRGLATARVEPVVLEAGRSIRVASRFERGERCSAARRSRKRGHATEHLLALRIDARNSSGGAEGARVRAQIVHFSSWRSRSRRSTVGLFVAGQRAARRQRLDAHRSRRAACAPCRGRRREATGG